MLGKSELAQRVARRTGLTNSKSNDVVNAVLDTITEALQSGEEVRVTGFGSFRVAETKARTGRNPRTGEAIQIAASRRPAFSAGSKLVDAVRGGGKTAARSGGRK